jgi:hypothetical protein|tara:strand:- start:15210 stop:15470 length:261 start_codon:yes stop_codon:yes gene_type:complete
MLQSILNSNNIKAILQSIILHRKAVFYFPFLHLTLGSTIPALHLAPGSTQPALHLHPYVLGQLIVHLHQNVLVRKPVVIERSVCRP